MNDKVDKELLSNLFAKIFKDYKPESRITTLYTGPAGYDLFDEAVERESGYYRIYLGKKVPGIISRTTKMIIHKSANGRYYKKFKKHV